MDIPTSFILIIILFDEVFKYGDGERFWGYVGTSAEPLCAEFFNATTWNLDHTVTTKTLGTIVAFAISCWHYSCCGLKNTFGVLEYCK
jgi:hypothetical protein